MSDELKKLHNRLENSVEHTDKGTSLEFTEEEMFNLCSDFYILHEKEKSYMQKYLNSIMYDLICAIKECENRGGAITEDLKQYITSTYCHIITLIDFAAFHSLPAMLAETAAVKKDVSVTLTELYLNHIGEPEFYDNLAQLTGISDEDFRLLCHEQYEENLKNTLLSIRKDFPDFLTGEHGKELYQMDIKQVNQITINGFLSRVTDDVENNITDCRSQYENINNDMFEESKQRLEVFLFRLYEFKYYVLPNHKDVSCHDFLTNDDYYKELMTKIQENLDAEAGLLYCMQALEYIKTKNYDEAGKLFFKSALCGNRGGQFNYGVTVSNGEGCEADSLEGAFWYWMAAKNGNAQGMMNLGIAYRNGSGVKESGDQMLYWYARAAATLTVPEAVYNLGLSLKHEEVLDGNVKAGLMLIQASEELEEEAASEFVIHVTSRIISILSPYVYNKD